MPSPKSGTVTFNVRETVAEIKKGRVEFRVDKSGIINSSIAKISFDRRKNHREFQGVHQRHAESQAGDARRASTSRAFFMSSTMSPSIGSISSELEIRQRRNIMGSAQML